MLMSPEEWKKAAQRTPGAAGVRSAGFAAPSARGVGVGGVGRGGDTGGPRSPQWGQPAAASAAPLAPAMPDLTITAKPSPEMQASIDAWKKRMAELQGKAATPDPNLQWQIDEYKKRMGQDNTTRAIERAAGAIRSQAAGMGEQANAMGAATGRGEGFGAAEIGDVAQANLARSAADIELGREKQLDQLLLGGQAVMGAPGQMGMGYQQMLNQMYGQNPYYQTAQLGLGQQNLGLQAYLGQLQAQAALAQAQARLYGSPLEWYQMLLNQV